MTEGLPGAPSRDEEEYVCVMRYLLGLDVVDREGSRFAGYRLLVSDHKVDKFF